MQCDSVCGCVLYSYNDASCKEGDVVCFNQPITLSTLPEEGGQVCMHCVWVVDHTVLCS